MRRQLTYANAVATLALVFAMSGGAIAAKHYLVNSTSQINPKVLNKLKGRTGATGKTGVAGAPGTPGREGPAGATGDRGPSAAFGVNQEDGALSFPAKALEKQVVLSLHLPPGNFSIAAKVVANNDSLTEDAEAHCVLLLGGTIIDPAFEVLRMTKEGGGADRVTIVVEGEGSLTAAGTTEVVCQASSTEGDWVDGAINALQVASLR